MVSRLYNLGARVMSHDESLHTYFSWLLYKGDGYQHNPMMHGPLQFHLIALSYFLFGPSDFSARLPAAMFSIATIVLAWHWRRYLGKTGGLIAGFMMLISPIMLFYGRYVREDPYAIFSGVLMLYAVLRYLEAGDRKYLYVLAAALLLHFIDKETSFMYTAELLLFLAVYFVARVTRQAWADGLAYRGFLLALALGILLLGDRRRPAIGGPPNDDLGIDGSGGACQPIRQGLAAARARHSHVGKPDRDCARRLALAGAGYFLVRGYTWESVRSERSFDLLVLSGTLVLPMLVPFLLKLFETQLHIQIPTTTAELQTVTLARCHDHRRVSGSRVRPVDRPRTALAPGLVEAGTRCSGFRSRSSTRRSSRTRDGFFTGVVGSLGYWLVQQGVQRGSQPWYYYLLVLVPVYEFLPLIGAVAAVAIAVRAQTTRGGDEPGSAAERNLPARASKLPQHLQLALMVDRRELHGFQHRWREDALAHVPPGLAPDPAWRLGHRLAHRHDHLGRAAQPAPFAGDGQRIRVSDKPCGSGDRPRRSQSPIPGAATCRSSRRRVPSCSPPSSLWRARLAWCILLRSGAEHCWHAC